MEKQSSVFLKACEERIKKGEPKYGPVRADERNRCKEAIEEVYDVHNYIVPLMLKKWPKIKETVEFEWAVISTFRLYRALLELQKIEVEMEQKTQGGVVAEKA